MLFRAFFVIPISLAQVGVPSNFELWLVGAHLVGLVAIALLLWFTKPGAWVRERVIGLFERSVELPPIQEKKKKRESGSSGI